MSKAWRLGERVRKKGWNITSPEQSSTPPFTISILSSFGIGEDRRKHKICTFDLEVEFVCLFLRSEKSSTEEME